MAVVPLDNSAVKSRHVDRQGTTGVILQKAGQAVVAVVVENVGLFTSSSPFVPIVQLHTAFSYHVLVV